MNKRKGIETAKLVLKEKITPEKGEKIIKKWLKNLEEQKLISKNKCTMRLCRALKKIKNGESSLMDFLTHLRQCILFFREQLSLSENLINLIDEEKIRKFKLEIYNKEVNAIRKYPSWFRRNSKTEKAMDDLYDLVPRRNRKRTIGDGILYNMLGYKNYLNGAQKTGVKASLLLPEGHTLLACLPTG